VTLGARPGVLPLYLYLPLFLILRLFGFAGFVVFTEATKVFFEHLQPIGPPPGLFRDLVSLLPRRPRFPPALEETRLPKDEENKGSQKDNPG
jgi:hypothetical protein